MDSGKVLTRVNSHLEKRLRKVAFSKCYSSRLKHKVGVLKLIHFQMCFQNFIFPGNNLSGELRTKYLSRNSYNGLHFLAFLCFLFNLNLFPVLKKKKSSEGF